MLPAFPLTLKAQRACVFCRSRKQACDKSLPKCSRCARRDRHCDYSADGTPSDSVSQRLPSSQEHEALVVVDRHCGCLEISVDGRARLLKAVTSHGCETMAQLSLSIRLKESGGVGKAIDRYFSTVHIWLPIINKEAFVHATKNLGTNADACFSNNLPLLLLCMCLVAQHRCAAIRHDPATNPLYLFVKKLFLISLAEHQVLSVLQAGVLIVAYECGHGLSAASYMTLASCIGLARVMKLDQDLPPALNVGHENAADPHVLCWSAIVLLDRIIALAGVDDCFPLLVPPPSDNSFESSLQSLRLRLASPRTYERNHWSFEATAAAAEMVGEAVACESPRHKISLQELSAVKSRTEQLVELLLEISQAEPLLACEVAPLGISALAVIRLRYTTAAFEDCDSKLNLELRSTFNMTLDTVWMTPEVFDKSGVDRTSLVVLCSTFGSMLRFAKHPHLEISEAGRASLQAALLSLREYWAIGDLYLAKFDELFGQSQLARQ